MKKFIKITAVIAAVSLIFCGCGKKNKDKDENKNTNTNTEITDTNNNENKEDGGKVSESGNKAENKNEEKEGTGLFLGMDDSNFAVIFVESKDVHFKIADSLDLVNSPVNIGDSVKFTYSENGGEKTLITIEKAQ